MSDALNNNISSPNFINVSDVSSVVKTTDNRLVFYKGTQPFLSVSAKHDIYVDYLEGYWYLVVDRGFLWKLSLYGLDDLAGRPYTVIVPSNDPDTQTDYKEKVQDAYDWLVNNVLIGCCPSGGGGASNVDFVANEAALPVTGEIGILYVAEDGSGVFIWNGTGYTNYYVEQVQSDWNETDNTQVDFIRNKPTSLPPSGTAGGDLQGEYPNPTVAGVRGHEFQGGTPSDGEVWMYKTVDGKWMRHNLVKGDVGLGNVDNTSDADKPISTATATALAGKEPTIPLGTTAQYWRGDKTWQTLPIAVYLEVVRAGAAVPSPAGTTRFMSEGFAGLSTTLISTICPQKVFTTYRVFISSAQPSTGNLIVRRIFYNVAGTVQATQELIIPANSAAGIYTFSGTPYDATALVGSYSFTLINNASASSGTVNSIESVYQ